MVGRDKNKPQGGYIKMVGPQTHRRVCGIFDHNLVGDVKTEAGSAIADQQRSGWVSRLSVRAATANKLPRFIALTTLVCDE